jgi:hypothetical protein
MRASWPGTRLLVKLGPVAWNTTRDGRLAALAACENFHGRCR